MSRRPRLKSFARPLVLVATAVALTGAILACGQTTSIGPTATSTSDSGGLGNDPTLVPTRVVLPTATSAPSSVIRAGYYQLQVSGTVAGYPISQPGNLFVIPAKARHALDVCFFVGNDPLQYAISPVRGAILFGSNSICVGTSGNYYTAQLDVANLAADPVHGTVVVTANPNYAELVVNAYDINGGITAGVHKIYEGTMTLQFSRDGGVVGSIDVNGCTVAPPCVGAEYHAAIAGTFAHT